MPPARSADLEPAEAEEAVFSPQGTKLNLFSFNSVKAQKRMCFAGQNIAFLPSKHKEPPVERPLTQTVSQINVIVSPG